MIVYTIKYASKQKFKFILKVYLHILLNCVATIYCRNCLIYLIVGIIMITFHNYVFVQHNKFLKCYIGTGLSKCSYVEMRMNCIH